MGPVDVARAGAARVGDAALATVGLGIAAASARAAGVGLACPFLSVTGHACPGCGLTRLAGQLVDGRLADAILRDPLGAALLALIASLAAVGALRRAGTGATVRPSILSSAPRMLVAIGLARWVFLVAGITTLA